MPKKKKPKAKKLKDFVIVGNVIIKRIFSVKALNEDNALARAEKMAKEDYPECRENSRYVGDDYIGGHLENFTLDDSEVFTLHEYKMQNDDAYREEHICPDCEEELDDCSCEEELQNERLEPSDEDLDF